MANTFKFGAGKWAAKAGSVLAYNDENNNFKPLPFTFTRASTATRVNESGLIESVSNGVPRIDYLDNADGHLLLEPSRTNLLTYSEAFTDASWTKTGISLVSNNLISPDGTLNATKIVESSSNSQHKIQETSVSIVAGSVIFSQFIKKGERNKVLLELGGGGGGFAKFNLDLGIVISESNVNATITEFSNNWYRCSVSFTSTASSVYLGTYILDDNEVLSYQGDGTSGIYIWGAQIEQGSYATSYIPTSGAAVTRTADVASNAGNAQVFNDSEGVLFVETKGFYDADLGGSSTYIQLSKSGESSFNNSLVLQHRNNGYLRVYVNGSATENIHFNEDIDFTQNHKIAVLYKLNGYKLFIDGLAKSLYLTPTQTVFSGLNNLSFDSRGATSWNGSIKGVRVYNTTLSDSELEYLTSYRSLSEMVTKLNLNTL